MTETEPTDFDPFAPSTWDDYIGQDKLKQMLRVHARASFKKGKPLDHILLAGPPGCGKTTLAHLVSSETGDQIMSVVMPIKRKLLLRIMRDFRGILFIDEFHRATKKEQEEFLTILTDGYMQLENGGKIENTWLTVIAATTQKNKLDEAIVSRFPIVPYFEVYTDEELAKIARNMALSIDYEITDEMADGIGRAAAGIPRNVRTLVSSAHDMATVSGDVTLEQLLEFKSMTADGLSREHQQYLRVLYDQDGRAGMSVLSNVLRLHPASVYELERLLIAKRMIVLGERGRELTGRGYDAVKNVTP